MRGNIFYILIFSLLLSSVSCIDEFDTPTIEEESNVVNFNLVTSSVTDIDFSSRTTTSDNELTIHRGYIFFFDAEGGYRGYEKLNLDSLYGNGGSSLSYNISANGYSNSHKLVCVFNYDRELNIPDDFSDMTVASIGETFSMSRTFLSKVQEDMNDQIYSEGMPMSVNDFVSSGTTAHQIYRSVARIEVAIASGLLIEADHSHLFSNKEVQYAIVNDASTGDMTFTSMTMETPHLTEGEAPIEVADFELTEFPYSTTLYDENDTQDEIDEMYKAYIYEFPYSSMLIDGSDVDDSTFSPKRMAIMLRHTDSESGNMCYYKLNLSDKPEDEYYDVVRNHDYRVVIKDISSHGYSTAKEAYAMPPSNIEYEIYDNYGNSTLSNGQYAISMDNVIYYDNIQIYGRDSTVISFTNIRYILPDDMTNNDMIMLENMTNSVTFNVLSTDSTMVISDIQNDFTDGKLTADGRDLSFCISGAGSCEITLLIKLGNLEAGSESITIHKGDSESSFDAHPDHLRLKTQRYIDNTWNSTDTDFGAWYDASTSETVIYMGDNAKPTGYRTMDGYVAGSNSKDSYPIFSDKSREGFYSYIDVATGDTIKTMIMLNQLAPFYVGHFGASATYSSSTHYYEALVVEKIEEVPTVETWSGDTISMYNGVIHWSEAYKTYYDATKIYGEYNGMYRFLNTSEGLNITEYIVNYNKTVGEIPTAALYCYMKNDINDNGVIDSDEPIEWYLPAQNQMLSMWVNMHVFETDLEMYGFTEVSDNPYYWTCTEIYPDYIGEWSMPTSFDNYVVGGNMLEGEMIIRRDKVNDYGHVRCVRGVDYTL